MPVGLSNLITGLTQGLAVADQKKRQDVLDARETERFDMQKQQFGDQQKASALSLQTNQFNLTNAQSEAARKKLLQEEADNFHKTMKGYFAKQATGDYRGFYADLEKDKQRIGINGQFLRDAKGNFVIDSDGSAVWSGGTLNGQVKVTPDSALEDFYNSYNPEKAIEARIASRSEIDKEKRQEATDDRKTTKANAHAVKLAGINNLAANYRTQLTVNAKNKEDKATIEQFYSASLPVFNTFFDIKDAKKAHGLVGSLTREQFVQRGLDNYALKNIGKRQNPAELQQARAALEQVADVMYQNTQSSVIGNANKVISGLTLPQPTSSGKPLASSSEDLLNINVE